MNEYKVFVCKHCGYIIEVFPNTHCCPTICCGEPMVELKANTTDAATEKHVPAVEVNGNTVNVQVGSIAHPMTEAHHIAFVTLITDKSVMRHDFNHTDEPVATFTLGADEKPLKVYEYCNLHGLWVKEL